jgi:hypothetical protein
VEFREWGSSTIQKKKGQVIIHMFCPHCATRNDDVNRFCTICGKTLPQRRVATAVAASPASAAFQPVATRQPASFQPVATQQAATLQPTVSERPAYAPYVAPPQANAPQWTPPPPDRFDLVATVRQPLNDPNAVKKIAIGGLVNLIPLVGGVLWSGWCLRYLESVIKRREASSLPEWQDWGDLLKRGFMQLVLWLPYSLVPMAIMMLALVPAMTGGITEETVTTRLMLPMIVTFVIGLLIAIPLPMAICRYVDYGTLKAGWDVKRVLSLVRANLGQYFLIIGACLAAGFALAILAGFAIIIPFAPMVIALCGGAAIATAANAAFGRYYVLHRAAAE